MISYHLISQVTAAAAFPRAPGGNDLVPQHALLSHKTCSYLTAAALWTNNVGGKFPCFRNHGGVELWLSVIKHLFSNSWHFFKIVNLFQEALAPVEPSTKVPFTAAAFNVAVSSMASTSALPQVSGKQNNPGRSLWVFVSDFPVHYNRSSALLSIGHKFPGKQDCPFLDICTYQDLESESFHIAQILLPHSWHIHHNEEVQIACSTLECYTEELK